MTRDKFTNMKQTSIDAFHSIEGKRETVQSVIVSVMSKFRIPLTSEQIAFYSGLRYDQIWKRMSELENKGIIKDTGEKLLNTSGREATLYRLIENN